MLFVIFVQLILYSYMFGYCYTCGYTVLDLFVEVIFILVVIVAFSGLFVAYCIVL